VQVKSRLASVALIAGLLAFGAVGAVAAPGNGGGQSSAAKQYGERPGKGCGDTNHVHTGPPGNPSNTECPDK